MLQRHTSPSTRVQHAPAPTTLAAIRSELHALCVRINERPNDWRELAHQNPTTVRDLCKQLRAMAHLLDQHEGKLDTSSVGMFYDARGFEETASLLRLYLTEAH